MTETEKKEDDKRTDTTVDAHTHTVDERLVAPAPISATPTAAPAAFIPAPKKPVTIDEGPRKRTRGEQIFDWFNYAGFGWIANEVVSGKISSNTIEEGSKLYKNYDGIIQKIYHVFEKGEFVKTSKLAKGIRTGGDMFVMTLGGHLMVLPIRFFENFKSGIVRGIDGALDGEAVQQSPERIKTYEAMDKEPQQSWGSLWQGRLVTVVSAIGMHFAIGDKDAWSTKLFKNTPADHWSSLHRINTSVSRFLGKTFEPSAREAIEAASAHPDFKYTVLSEGALKGLQKLDKDPGLAHEGRIASVGKNYGLVFMVSGVLAATFYITSKLFASERDKKKAHMEEHIHSGTHHVGLDTQTDTPSNTTQLDSTANTQDRPAHMVSNVALAQRLEPTAPEAAIVG